MHIYTLACIHLYIHVYICICLLCVHVPAGNTSSFSLLIESGNVKQQQPQLCQAVGSGMIYFPLTHIYVCTYISFIYTHTFSLYRQVSFGEANGLYRINCPWNELIMVV